MTMHSLPDVFRAAAVCEFMDVPEENKLEWEFSPHFLRRIKRIHTASRVGYWKWINTASKRAVCVVAVIILMMSAVMGIEPIRISVLEFVVEFQERFFSITFLDEDNNISELTQTPLERYTFSTLPNGFKETEFQDLVLFYRTVWSNQAGESIILEQGNGQEEITLDAEMANAVTIEKSGGTEVLCYPLENSITMIWAQDGYSFSVTCSGEFDVEQVLDLIEKIEIIQK